MVPKRKKEKFHATAYVLLGEVNNISYETKNIIFLLLFLIGIVLMPIRIQLSVLMPIEIRIRNRILTQVKHN
jgi:hypothetical protein